MEHRPSNQPDVQDHEHSDIPVGFIAKFMLGMGVAGVVIVLVLGGLWNMFRESIPDEARVPSWAGPRELPPAPRLQLAPHADLLEYQKKEFERLNGYGWVDRPAGKVHIPIEQAIDKVVRTGLPARQQRPEGAPDTR